MSSHPPASHAALSSSFRARLATAGAAPPAVVRHRSTAAAAVSQANRNGWLEGYEAVLRDLIALKIITADGEAGSYGPVDDIRLLLGHHGSPPPEITDLDDGPASANASWSYHEGWCEGYEAALRNLFELGVLTTETEESRRHIERPRRWKLQRQHLLADTDSEKWPAISEGESVDVRESAVCQIDERTLDSWLQDIYGSLPDDVERQRLLHALLHGDEGEGEDA